LSADKTTIDHADGTDDIYLVAIIIDKNEEILLSNFDKASNQIAIIYIELNKKVME